MKTGAIDGHRHLPAARTSRALLTTATSTCGERLAGVSTPDALQQIEGTFGDLDLWDARTTAGFVPEPGSPLALDDEDWKPWRLSQLAIGGLAASHDHLEAIRVHIEARRLFPLATDTLLRGALLGAAQAVWLLAPEDQATRLDFSRCAAAEMHRRHREWLSDLRKIPAEPHEGTEKVYAHVFKREGELQAKREAIGQARKFDSTNIIERAAAAAFGPATATEARTVWRALSGAAHGLSWPMLGRVGTQQTSAVDDDGMADFRSGGSLDASLNGYFLAYRLSVKGWELLDLRGSVPA